MNLLRVAAVCLGLVVPGAAAAGPVNDLLVDFGSHGLWVRLNNATWKRLDAQDPEAVAGCDGRIFASFTGRGLLARSVAGDWARVRSEVPIALATGDTDGNGVCDLAASVEDSATRGRLLVELNGNPDAWIKLWDDKPFRSLALGDLDSIPNDDIVAVPFGPDAYVGPNNLSVSLFRSTHPLDAVATGDIDGDGRDEIVAVRDNRLKVIFGPPFHQTFLALRGELAVGDLDADPRDDIAFSSLDFPGAVNSLGTFVLFNNAPPAVRVSGNYAFHLAVADLNNDGRGDVVADFGSRGVWVRYGSHFQLLRAWRSEALVPCACD